MANPPNRNIYPVIGRRIKLMRLRMGWTQSQLAAPLGVPQVTISYWERAQRHPSIEDLLRLCEVLDTRWIIPRSINETDPRK